MKLFAISDLHLSFGSDKPMDIFGDKWAGHAERIASQWRADVGEDDWVLMGGDLSWAIDLAQVKPDLDFVESLPGQKLMIKGNHAHWWSGPKKVRAALPPSIRILNYDSFVLPDGTCIVGTRGWNPPGRSEGRPYSDSDRKIYERELGRFRLSLQDSEKKREQWHRRWAMIHYPPRYSWGLETGFVPMLQEAGIERCIYGHLHGKDHKSGFVGVHEGVEYLLVACDYTDMRCVPLD